MSRTFLLILEKNFLTMRNLGIHYNMRKGPSPGSLHLSSELQMAVADL